MADNVTLPGTGAVVATDEVGGAQYQIVKLAYGADGVATLVSTGLPVTPSSTDDVISVALSLDTNLYASGDVLAELQAIAGAVVTNGGKALLHSVTVIDIDDQGVSLELVFSSSGTASLGTENLAVSISDADAASILGIVAVASSDYIDLGGCRVATKTNVGLLLEAGAATTSLYVGAVARGAGTFSAAGITLVLGFLSRT